MVTTRASYTTTVNEYVTFDTPLEAMVVVASRILCLTSFIQRADSFAKFPHFGVLSSVPCDILKILVPISHLSSLRALGMSDVSLTFDNPAFFKVMLPHNILVFAVLCSINY